MEAALLGLVSAFSWGIHDFLARFAGRRFGYVNAVLGSTLTGLIGLGVLLAATRGLTVPASDGLVYLVITGAGIALATMWLFAALSMLPISIASPVVSAYPLPAVLIAVALGSRPSVVQWLAMAAVIVGVVVVARVGGSGSLGNSEETSQFSKGLMFAVLSNLGFAVATTAGQEAALYYDEFEVTFYARIVGLITILPFYLRPMARLPVPPRWLPGLAAIGALDVVALSALVAAGRVPSPEIAIVLASSFGAITVLLGWLALKERIAPLQWLGMVLIFTGAAILSLM